MVETPDRRRAARLAVPSDLRGCDLQFGEVWLLDLSATGARIEHPGQLHEGLVCSMNLPPRFGRVRLTARVVWTQFHKGEQTFEGEKHFYHQSGLVFMDLTPEQQTALTAALELLKTVPTTPEGKPGQGGGTPGPSHDET